LFGSTKRLEDVREDPSERDYGYEFANENRNRYGIACSTLVYQASSLMDMK